MKYNTKIPIKQGDIRHIIQSFEDGYYEYFELEKEHPTTTHNGRGASIWNHIFTQLDKHFKTDGYQVNKIQRGLWEVLYVYDESSYYLYTYMRYKNFINLQNKEPENRLFHYCNVLSRINGKLLGTYEPENEQMSFGLEKTIIDEEADQKLTELLNEMIYSIKGKIETYALVLVNQEKGKVRDIECKIPIENLDSIYTESWNEFIGTDYDMDEYINEFEDIELQDTEILLTAKQDNVLSIYSHVDLSEKEDIDRKREQI
ncbi:MAG: phiCD27 1 [Anaerocolumna sp.]|jgi:hypothetical protein|nr:phiCD27 1 [Anaerocolumna sp.]